ncbi:hypothetical protein DFH08DRAFT_824223 [Mycena albidolilacea]|uniref:Uncharacterized protein n=1 Tax=Mycena albidolilacea TaxID=1033008 RepID=A0AAD6Z5N7_9AGAR|nr:hypothetical protein DFH08DRAFT_824223 [Mycena albidolilacea]
MKRSSTAAGPAKKKAKNIYSLKSFGHLLTALTPAPPVARTGNLTSDSQHADIRNIALDSRHSPGPSSPLGPLGDGGGDGRLGLGPELNPGGAAAAGATGSCGREWYVLTDDALRYWVTNF